MATVTIKTQSNVSKVEELLDTAKHKLMDALSQETQFQEKSHRALYIGLAEVMRVIEEIGQSNTWFDDLQKLYKRRELNFRKDGYLELHCIKAIAPEKDRRRASDWAKALQNAKNENQSPDTLVDWLTGLGGVDKAAALYNKEGKKKATPPTNDELKDFANARAPIGHVEIDKSEIKPHLGIVALVARNAPDGKFEILGVCDNDKVINSLLKAFYDQNPEDSPANEKQKILEARDQAVAAE